jgi:hypothetical protein
MAREGTVGWLREVCREFKRDLLSAEHATEDEIAAIWPGGKDNPERRIRGWIRCYGKLHAINAVAVRGRVERGSVTNAERQEATLAALADTPEVVDLIVIADEAPRRVTVYPKSYVALNEIGKREAQIAWLVDECTHLEKGGTLDDLDALLRARDEQTYLQRVNAWIATSHGVNGKACGLPFHEEELRPELPADFPDLHPLDFPRIAAAFQRVNKMRLLMLDMSRKSEARADWSVFLTTYAEQTNRATSDVMRDLSLPSVIAQAAERARGHEQATLAAERERKQRERLPKQQQVA